VVCSEIVGGLAFRTAKGLVSVGGMEGEVVSLGNK